MTYLTLPRTLNKVVALKFENKPRGARNDAVEAQAVVV